ncbi:MAG: hypothetical protein HY269_09785 [Deltaproteobacteria bacterium]|nr:hypothetical protein [Deltaproteobacteria bacterium]
MKMRKLALAFVYLGILFWVAATRAETAPSSLDGEWCNERVGCSFFWSRFLVRTQAPNIIEISHPLESGRWRLNFRGTVTGKNFSGTWYPYGADLDCGVRNSRSAAGTIEGRKIIIHLPVLPGGTCNEPNKYPPVQASTLVLVPR